MSPATCRAQRRAPDSSPSTGAACRESWRCNGLTCREENKEASAILDKIYEVASGGLTDGEPMWFLFGNPTRNTGYFRETHGRRAAEWTRRQIDSRDVEGTNKALLERWVREEGEDSDFVRVRVRGIFPRASSLQFVDVESVDAATKREVPQQRQDALVIGVDVARFGDDMSVIRFRRGRDARSIPPVKLRNADTMQLAARVIQEMQTHRADAVFVDEGGVGAGVVDRLRQLRAPVFGVNFGARADGAARLDEDFKAKNKRAEMWAAMRAWLKGGAIDNDADLRAGLTGVEYGFDENNAIQLERKERMKQRGFASPDDADALALTFAWPVMPRPTDARGMPAGMRGGGLVSEYDPLRGE